jgi:HAD superfamily hydrolase (TIGR01509 family)
VTARKVSYYPAVLRAVLLDLDDTLYDRSVAFAAWANERALQQHGRALTADELAMLRRIDGRGHRPRADFAADARELLVFDPARFALELAEHVTPEPDVHETLVELARTHRVAIVTNGGPAQRIKLARIGLAGVPHAVFVSMELGFAKPDPRVFEHVQRWTEVAPDETLFVGDHPEADIAGAAAAGMRTAWRARDAWPAHLAPPTYTIERISQLRELA